MTIQSRTYLKGRFETGDIPNQTDYVDLIDSFLSLETTAGQTINGAMTFVEKITGSAASFTGVVSAQTLHVDSLVQKGHADYTGNGTTQGAGTSISVNVAHLTVSDAGDRAFRINETHPGVINYLVNSTSSVTAAAIYPTSGSNFIGTAANSPLLLASGTTIQIIHIDPNLYTYQRY